MHSANTKLPHHQNYTMSPSTPKSHRRSHTYTTEDEADLFEPSSPDPFSPRQITRHDSGYESAYAESKKTRSRRSSVSRRPHHSSKRSSHRSRGLKTRSVSPVHNIAVPTSYFYFPSLDGLSGPEEEVEEEVVYEQPPQTVHYWMSDDTRRLEYAAIDAASRGVKGWLRKHVIPNCLVPKESRRLTFDDDSGSVRRYRLELDGEGDGGKGKSGRKLGWLFRRG